MSTSTIAASVLLLALTISAGCAEPVSDEEAEQAATESEPEEEFAEAQAAAGAKSSKTVVRTVTPSERNASYYGFGHVQVTMFTLYEPPAGAYASVTNKSGSNVTLLQSNLALRCDGGTGGITQFKYGRTLKPGESWSIEQKCPAGKLIKATVTLPLERN